jgi:hypothetical protein
VEVAGEAEAAGVEVEAGEEAAVAQAGAEAAEVEGGGGVGGGPPGVPWQVPLPESVNE